MFFVKEDSNCEEFSDDERLGRVPFVSSSASASMQGLRSAPSTEVDSVIRLSLNWDRLCRDSSGLVMSSGRSSPSSGESNQPLNCERLSRMSCWWSSPSSGDSDRVGPRERLAFLDLGEAGRSCGAGVGYLLFPMMEYES